MSAEPSDFLKEYYARKEKMKDELPDRGRALKELLLKLGVTKVVASYSGSGDSGQIEDVSVEPETLELEEKVREEIHQFLYDVLEVRYAGWEINDGSSGEFNWDLTKVDEKVGFQHKHSSYYTESNDTEHEGFQ